MSANTVRVWRLRNWSDDRWDAWHVSIGDVSPLRDLCRMVGGDDGSAPGFDTPVGMTWDEALGSFSFALISPGALGPLRRSLEPPGPDWELLLEAEPSAFGGFDASSACRRWERLDLGEVLATFVRETFPEKWKGFEGDPYSRSLVSTRGVNADH